MPGLDGLAEAHVVGDQQVDPWHLDRPDHRVELVVLDVDAGAERRLDRSVGGRSGTPADGVEEGVELVGRVEAGGLGQGDLLDDLGPRLELPDDLQLFAQAVVLDRGERHQVLTCIGRGFIGSAGRALLAFTDDTLARPDIDELALFRRTGCTKHYADSH